MRDKLSKKELEKFIQSHKVIYIRHNLLSSVEAYKCIVLDGIVAVHYTEKLRRNVDREILDNHRNPENFEGSAQGVLKRFNRYCVDGAVVFADYSDPDYTNTPMVNVGIIPEGKGYDVKRYPQGFTYKQIELVNYVTLDYSELAPFLAIHPRGGTISEFNAENAVKFVYRKAMGLPVNFSVDCLLPAQLEVLCSEFLRTKANGEIRINYLLMPVGRGMKTIDIDGINEY